MVVFDSYDGWTPMDVMETFVMERKYCPYIYIYEAAINFNIEIKEMVVDKMDVAFCYYIMIISFAIFFITFFAVTYKFDKFI